MKPIVLAVCSNASHTFSKIPRSGIRLVQGLGVEGDAHAGVSVQHRSRVAADPSQPNLRQVHLVHSELFAELQTAGYDIRPGDIGENVTTVGLDLLGLPEGALIRIGRSAVVEVTGLRNPCLQLNAFREGLMEAVLDRAEDGSLIRKAGIMGIVRESGDVYPGDSLVVALPPEPHRRLERV